jgi:hypothetical protein
LKEDLLQYYKAEAKTMKKQLVIVGIVALLVCVGLSGCTNQQQPTQPQAQEPPKEEPPERSYFILTGKIHNGYDTKVDVDYIITSSGDWHDLGRTIYGINQNGENSFSSNVKTGFGEYTLLIGWFYPYTDTQFDRCDYKFSNPSAKDMSFDIVILPSGKIIISE